MTPRGPKGRAAAGSAWPGTVTDAWARATASIPSAAGRVVAFREWLAEVEVEELSDRERIELVAQLERVKGASSATQARAAYAVAESRTAAAPGDAKRSVGSEVALARRESPTSGDRFVGLSRALVTSLPETMAALAAGECSERHAAAVARASGMLSADQRAELDRRVGPLLPRLGVDQADRAAQRVASELDAAAVVHRMEAAVRSRRVTVRRAPDGMGYLTVLGPMVEVAGAHAALVTRARAVASGQDEEPHHGRGTGAIAADTALAVLSGRAPGSVQPVEVHLVMTDRALLGTGDRERSVMEPARLPGVGSLPAPVARWWLSGAAPGSVWVRRLYTSPTGRDLVAMDSRRRVFGGLLRRMLVLRDDLCATPWCGAAIAHADHTHPARDEGPTDLVNGSGLCARCNHVKEAPGWRVQVRRPSPRELEVRTPTGRTYRSQAPPLLGWGTDPPSEPPPRHDRMMSRAPGIRAAP